MEEININYKSDFKLRATAPDGSALELTPFRLTYYTSKQRGTHVAEYDGKKFTNCYPDGKGGIIIPIRGEQLGRGTLWVDTHLFFTDSDFKNGICNYRSTKKAGVLLGDGVTDDMTEIVVGIFPFYQQGKSAYDIWLEEGNEGTIEDFLASLKGEPFEYEDFTQEQLDSLKGPKGDTFTYDDLTDEQKKDLAYQVIGDAEDKRRAAEAIREEQEIEREQAEALRKQAEEARENTFAANEKARQDTFAANESARQDAFDANEAIREANETSRQDAEVVREENERRREETYQQKVDREDNAPKLTAGFANNLVGRGEATPQEIFFRPSGGDTSIEDGTARIDKVKGSTLVWNQFCDFNKVTNSWYVTIIDKGRNSITLNATKAGNYFRASYKLPRNFAGRKILISYSAKASREIDTSLAAPLSMGVGITQGVDNLNGPFIFGKNLTTEWTKLEGIKQASSAKHTALMVQFSLAEEEDFTLYVKDVVVYDLTQMFGEGNEPTTIEEFHARKPLNIDEYAYNEGELISNNVEELKSVGFNAWDEQWVNGYYTKNGFTANPNYVAMKNPIKVIAGLKYYFSNKVGYSASFLIAHYDKYDNYIDVPNVDTNGRVTLGNYSEYVIPDGVHYIRVFMANTYGTTYNNDICIHLVHTGYRNGEYEPYKEFKRDVPIKDIKDNDGNQLFPNGLLSAGSVCDEITATKAIKRIGVVDMGTLDWLYYPNPGYHTSLSVTDLMTDNDTTSMTVINCITPKYKALSWNSFAINYQGNRDYAISRYMLSGRARINILDDDYTDAATFKAAMSGVMLYYELAEPIEVDLPEPLNLNYEVSDFGTEEVLSSEPTTPMKADIIYLFNAVDRIRDNSRHTAEADKKLLDYESRIKALEAIAASLTSSES